MTRAFDLSGSQIDQMADVMKEHPGEMLFSSRARQALARSRYQGHVDVAEIISAGVMERTVAHNRRIVDSNDFSACYRTQRLIGPLSALDPIYNYSPQLKVLSIGPRTEMEIYHLLAIGFRIDNITAVDLISSSPLIDTGDMHSLSYADNSFGVILCGWTLGYSSDPQKVVNEILRVAENGAIIAIGNTHEPEYQQGMFGICGCDFATVAELQSLFGDSIAEVCFRQDRPKGTQGVVILIVRVRK